MEYKLDTFGNETVKYCLAIYCNIDKTYQIRSKFYTKILTSTIQNLAII